VRDGNENARRFASLRDVARERIEVIFATRAVSASSKKLRSFSQFVFFPRRFRFFPKNIFHRSGDVFERRFDADECFRAREFPLTLRAMVKSIVVHNAASRSSDVALAMWLQAASLLGFPKPVRIELRVRARFVCICV
jgi:hypothetical protein